MMVLSTKSLVALFLLVSCVSSVAAQSSTRLKLKLREDETIKYRHVLNVTTYAPDDITERVGSAIFSLRIGDESNGKMPVTAKIEAYEGIDPGSNTAIQAMSRVSVSFSTDEQGNVEGFAHTAQAAELEPVAIIIDKSLQGIFALGLLGVSTPEGDLSSGKQWTRKVSSDKFFGAVLGPAGDMFKVGGELEATFTLVDVVSVNKRQQARLQVKTKGSAPIHIAAPDNELDGKMEVNSEAEIYIDLDTGLVSLSRTNTSAEIDLGVANITVSVQELLYRL